MANKKEISVELKKASEPLAKFLEKYYNPMATAVVTICDVTILSGEIKVHINESYDNSDLIGVHEQNDPRYKFHKEMLGKKK